MNREYLCQNLQWNYQNWKIDKYKCDTNLVQLVQTNRISICVSIFFLVRKTNELVTWVHANQLNEYTKKQKAMLRLFVATCTRQGLASRTSSNQLRKPCNFVVASKWMSSKPTEPYDPSEPNEPTIPPFIEKFEEPIHEKRARLLYQVSLCFIFQNSYLIYLLFLARVSICS